MRWRENGDKVERARVRTEPRSKWARRPVKERDYACRRVSTVQGASTLEKRACSVAAPAAGTLKRSVHKKTRDLWGLLGELFCGGENKPDCPSVGTSGPIG